MTNAPVSPSIYFSGFCCTTVRQNEILLRISATGLRLMVGGSGRVQEDRRCIGKLAGRLGCPDPLPAEFECLKDVFLHAADRNIHFFSNFCVRKAAIAVKQECLAALQG